MKIARIAKHDLETIQEFFDAFAVMEEEGMGNSLLNGELIFLSARRSWEKCIIGYEAMLYPACDPDSNVIEFSPELKKTRWLYSLVSPVFGVLEKLGIKPWETED